VTGKAGDCLPMSIAKITDDHDCESAI
jgi:hypothetical protein